MQIRYFLFLLLIFASQCQAKIKVGITLHPYYSYVKNIVMDRAEVIPLIEAGFNPHSYKLAPADLVRLKSMNAIVINGIGHDEFATEAIKRINLPNLSVIEANDSVPLIGKSGSNKFNPHTFVSIDAAIRQVYTIARKLAEIDQANGEFYKRNAFNYAKQLRSIKTKAISEMTSLNLSNIRIASTHNAYGYLLQEFGMTVSAVVEPAHGVSPNAAQLQSTIDKIRKANIHVLFTELNMPNRYLDIIEAETQTRLFHFSHMTYGEYRNELVIEDMTHNLETLVSALRFAVIRANDDS